MEGAAERPPVERKQRDQPDHAAGAEADESLQVRRACARRTHRARLRGPRAERPSRRRGRRGCRPLRSAPRRSRRRAGGRRRRTATAPPARARTTASRTGAAASRARGSPRTPSRDPARTARPSCRTSTSSRSDGRTTAHRPICQIARNGMPSHRGRIPVARVRVARDGARAAEDEVPRRRPEVHRADPWPRRRGLRRGRVACLGSPAVDGRMTCGEGAFGGVVGGLRAADRLHRQRVRDRDAPSATAARTVARFTAGPYPARRRRLLGPGRPADLGGNA